MKFLVAGLALVVGVASQAAAQSYPNRSITMIVPLAAGATADILARTVAAEVSKAFGQTIVVDNRPGAGGTIAMAQVARATPDGYTIAVISQGTHVFNLGLFPKLDYDPLKDFAPIAIGGSVSNVLIVHPTNPATSVKDVIAQAKAKPGELTYASGGNGTSHHISGVLFQTMIGTPMTHVPYRATPAGIAAVMQGEVAIGFFNTPTVIAQIKDGKLKPLGVTSLQRSPHLPQLPTLDEAGVKGYEMITWLGFAAPAGTPAAIVERWHSEIAKVMAVPAMREKMVAMGFDLMEQMSPAAFAQFISTDAEKWVPIVKASGATVD
jgi:tripartite-type tricarboxylate transporter receptor subunit TctC